MYCHKALHNHFHIYNGSPFQFITNETCLNIIYWVCPRDPFYQVVIMYCLLQLIDQEVSGILLAFPWRYNRWTRRTRPSEDNSYYKCGQSFTKGQHYAIQEEHIGIWPIVTCATHDCCLHNTLRHWANTAWWGRVKKQHELRGKRSGSLSWLVYLYFGPYHDSHKDGQWSTVMWMMLHKMDALYFDHFTEWSYLRDEEKSNVNLPRCHSHVSLQYKSNWPMKEMHISIFQTFVDSDFSPKPLSLSIACNCIHMEQQL